MRRPTILEHMVVPTSEIPTDDSFPSTHWSELRGEARARALERLAHAYQGPIRAWLRAAQLTAPDEAADLAQDFFVWVLETGFLEKVERSRGSFRAFLKTALRHYSARAHERASALKRGGGTRFVPLAGGPAEPELIDRRTPEAALDAAGSAEVVPT